MKNYFYVNDLGYSKMITVADEVIADGPNKGKYEINLWDMVHGEWCGYGYKTKDEINEFLQYYKVNGILSVL